MANIDDKYIALQKWMVTQLKLSGSELIIYGYIYSFQFKSFWNKETPDKVTPTEIPISDFMAWTGLKKRGVIYILQGLQERGYIKTTKTPGHLNAYEVCKEPVVKAMQGTYSSGAIDCTSAKKEVVQKVHRGGALDCTTSGATDCTVVVQNIAQSGAKIAPHSIRNTKNTQKILEYKNAPTREDASASPLSTETDDDYRNYTKVEIEFYEKQALKRLNETDAATGQKAYLSSNPMDQFPKAFLFMTAKKTDEFNDMEFELFKMISLFTAYGVAKKEEIVTQEEAEYVPPASEIGQEAHDAQRAFVDWVFHGGESPIQMARRK